METDEGMDVVPIAASHSGVAHGATDADLALAELFGVEVGEQKLGRFLIREMRFDGMGARGVLLPDFRDLLVVVGRGQHGLSRML